MKHGATKIRAFKRYDALGRRLAKIVTENGNFKRATRFVYDGWNVVEERRVRNFSPLGWVERAAGGFFGRLARGGLRGNLEVGRFLARR